SHAAGATSGQRKAILTSFEPARVIAELREVFSNPAESMRSAA
ncbi:MAG: tRNA dihydrouridine synthase DusB, partial [Mesorhizobium sp.]